MARIRSPRRRRFGRAVTDLHIQLRTEGDTPLKKALSVGLGVAVGFQPLLGLHLPLCAALARLLGLSRVRAYLAAHISNPVTFPLLVYLEIGTGRLLAEGRWPDLALTDLRLSDVAWSALGRDLVLGALALGLVAGTLAAAAAWWIGRRWRKPPFRALLDEETARRYADTGIAHWETVRGKLHWDPVFHAILRQGLLPRQGLVADLGCGRGILLALLATARELYREGSWDETWAPPGDLSLYGIERRRPLAAVARMALADVAHVQSGDLVHAALPRCQAAVLFDVLHYLDAGDQETLVRRAAAALAPGGVLLVREADAAAGWRFSLVRTAERSMSILRGRPRQRFHYRNAEEWERLLAAEGLTVGRQPMAEGTPFANVLLVACREDAEGRRRPEAQPA